MTSPTAVGTLNAHTVAGFLDAAGIDQVVQSDDSVYVTGLNFNFWIQSHADDHALTFYTNWPLRPSVSEDIALRFVNMLNTSKILVQFAHIAEKNLMAGHAWMSCKDGFSGTQMVRTATRFASIFGGAVAEGLGEGLFGEISGADAGDD